jgi:hypothetical protein
MCVIPFAVVNVACVAHMHIQSNTVLNRLSVCMLCGGVVL